MRDRNAYFSYWSISILVVITLCTMLSLGAVVYGEETNKPLPPRSISVAPSYTGVIVPQEEAVDLDLNVINGGSRGEDIQLAVTSIPGGWDAWIKTYNYRVTGIHVPSDESKSLTFRAEPGDSVGPGTYTFVIGARTSDGELSSSCRVRITVKLMEKETIAKGVTIVTSYPVLQGPTDATFEFSVEVENETDKDAIFNLISQGPENWEVKFKPAYEDKYFSSLRIKAGQRQTLALEVKPYPFSEPGEYPILFKISSPEASGEAKLAVLLTGTHKLEVGTPNGLLSLNAMRGKEANLSFYIMNSGSATLSNLRFLTFKPENWQITFSPEKVDVLNPAERKQIEATIVPSDQALVGDYSVVLSTEGGKEPKNLELRVTVRASTAWGWIGIGIIVLVMAGLVTLFIRFGRR